MTRYDKRFWLLAAGLAGMAGYVDAIGFLKLGGLFVSFMSGNTTRLAVGIVTDADVALTAACLLVTFVAGVMAGTVLAAIAGRYRKSAVLAFVAVFLAIPPATDGWLPARWTTLAMAAAMGATNTVFQRSGEVSIAVTYMTGTLVKFGQRLTATLLGGSRWAWLPHLVLWIALASGAVAGGIAWTQLGPGSMWIACVVALLLTVYAVILGPADEAVASPAIHTGESDALAAGCDKAAR